MFLLPEPKEVNLKEGFCKLSPEMKIVLDTSCNFNDLKSAQLLQEEVERKLGFKLGITKRIKRDSKKHIFLTKNKGQAESYELIIMVDRIIIAGADDAGLFYGVQTLRQLLRLKGINLPALNLKDSPWFKNRGFYHDITRGKVPTLDTLKELVDKAAFYKINQLQLYIEHSFAFEAQSEVWFDKDPLTAEEILELDEYCKRNHIELVPSLSTFGHLYEVLTTNSFNHLCELEDSLNQPYSWWNRQLHHTLDVSNAKSIEFVQEMIEEFIPLFSSDKFNICCDETFDLGRGRSKELAEKKGKGRLYVDFLVKIINSVKKYDKEVMFWGDIILKYPELIKEIPSDVTCLHWDYAQEPNEKRAETIGKSNLAAYFCPGVSGWNMLMNDIDNSFNNISSMVSYAQKYEKEGILNTDWGDYGHINYLSNSIPGMILGAALSWNPDSSYKEDFSLVTERISKIEFEDNSGKLIDLLRELANQQGVTWCDINQWKENKYDESLFDTTSLDIKFRDISFEELNDKYLKALKISQEILKFSSIVPKVHYQKLQEFYISGKGIALFNLLAMMIKKYDYNQEVKSLQYTPEQLAKKIEYWFVDYSKLWRIRNKESELYRLRDAFKKICDYLRKI